MVKSDAPEIRILLPLGPDEDCREAARLLAALFPADRVVARRLYVRRPIQHEYFLPEMTYSLPEVARIDMEAQMATVEQSRRGSKALSDEGFRVEADVVTGSAATEVLREIRLWEADLAAVRTRRGGLSEDRLGGLTASLIQHADCPVLVYPAVPDAYTVRRILIATDFSEASRSSADWGLALAELTGAEAHLLHVLARRSSRVRLEEEDLVRVATDEIARWRHSANPAFPRPVTDAHVISAETPADGILRFADDLGFDFVVLAGTGRSAVGALFLGSNARTVARTCPKPLLMVPAGSHVSPAAILAKLGAASEARAGS